MNGSPLVARIRASDAVIFLNRRSSQRARFRLPMSPKLFPYITIVSNRPSRELT